MTTHATIDELIAEAIRFPTHSDSVIAGPTEDRLYVEYVGKGLRHEAPLNGAVKVEYVALVAVVTSDDAFRDRLASTELLYGDRDEDEMRAAIDMVLASARLRIAEQGRSWLQGKRWLLGKIALDASEAADRPGSFDTGLLAIALRRQYATVDELRGMLIEALPDTYGAREGWRERLVDGWLERAEGLTDRQLDEALLRAYDDRVRPLHEAVQMVTAADAALDEARRVRDDAIRAARAAGQPVAAIATITGLKPARVHEVLKASES